MSEPTTPEQPAVAPTVSTAPARSRWSKLPSHLGRARTSTLVLAVLFLAIGALWINIRPDEPSPAATISETGTEQEPVPVVPTTTAPETTAEPTTEAPETTEAPTTSAELSPTTDEPTPTPTPTTTAPRTTEPLPTFSSTPGPPTSPTTVSGPS